MINSAFDVCPSGTDTSHRFFGSEKAADLVIFIHGLCGDAETTWTNPNTKFVFPEALAQDFGTNNHPAYVVSFDYVSHLQGGPSIPNIAKHLEFEIDELLKKNSNSYHTLRIVAHSMGGLVAREYILRRHPHAHPQLKVAGMVMLATPNNGSELSKLGQLISENRQVQEVSHIDKSNTYLESLNNDWNQEFKREGHPRHIFLYAGYEELATSVVGHIVKLSSAVSFADQSLGFQQDHVSIAKPEDRTVSLYRWVKAKLEESLEKTVQNEGEGAAKQGLSLAGAASPEKPQVRAGFESERESQLNKVAYQAYSQNLRNMSRPLSCYERHNNGAVLFKFKMTERAISELEEAVILCRNNNDLYVEGLVLDDLGVAYNALRKYSKAIEYHEKALEISKRMEDREGELRILENLSYAYANDGQNDKSATFLKKSKVIKELLQEDRLRIKNLQETKYKQSEK
jgi:tetratricopeptide (TPR) repeat protein